METLLEISKPELRFCLLQTEDKLIEAECIIPLENQELSTAIISQTQKAWEQVLEDYYYAFKRANNEEIQISETLKIIENFQTNASYIRAKSDYIIKNSQVRTLQDTLGNNKLLSPSEYVNINKILITYERFLAN